MRLSGKLILHQPIPNMVTYGKRSFAYGGPRLWNNLHIKLRTIVSPETFKRELKHTYINLYTHVKGIMRSKNTYGYFSFYVDNISLKHIPLGIFHKFPLNPIK